MYNQQKQKIMETKNQYSVSSETAAILDCYRNANVLYLQVRDAVFALRRKDGQDCAAEETAEKMANAQFVKFEEPMQNVIKVLKDFVMEQIDESLVFGENLCI